MHEYSIVQALFDRIQDAARERGAVAVRRVKLRIGEIAGVDVDLLQTAYDLFRVRTICEGAWLDVEQVPARWTCPGGHGDIARGHALVCPACARPARLAAGDEAPDPPPEVIRPRLYPGERERAAVDALLKDVPRDGAQLLALAPGSIWGTKRWPHFPALAARLAPLYRLVVVGGADDNALAAEIARASGPERVINATGKLSLLASTELLSRCAALVTNDSAPQHLASAAGTPTLSIFGPTAPEFGFGPLAPRHATVGNQSLTCRPCHPHGPEVCPLGHWKCMRELEVEQVSRALNSLLLP